MEVRKIKDNLYFCLGFIQGDGCLGRLDSPDHLGMEVNIGYKDDDIFGYFNIDKIDGCRSYYVNGYNGVCKELGFSSNPLPERPLPTTFNVWDDLNKIEFLKGLYSANGSFISVGRIAFKTTCKKLSEQLKQVLTDFGFNPYITTNKSKNVKFSNGTYRCRESYDVNLGRIFEVKRFYEEIGFAQQYKMNNISKYLKKKLGDPNDTI